MVEGKYVVMKVSKTRDKIRRQKKLLMTIKMKYGILKKYENR